MVTFLKNYNKHISYITIIIQHTCLHHIHQKIVEKKVLTCIFYTYTPEKIVETKEIARGPKKFERETICRVEWPNAQYCAVLFLLYQVLYIITSILCINTNSYVTI